MGMSTQKQRSEAAAELGRKGGAMNIKKHGKGRMSQIGKIGAKRRWSKKDVTKREDQEE